MEIPLQRILTACEAPGKKRNCSRIFSITYISSPEDHKNLVTLHAHGALVCFLLETFTAPAHRTTRTHLAIDILILLVTLLALLCLQPQHFSFPIKPSRVYTPKTALVESGNETKPFLSLFTLHHTRDKLRLFPMPF